LIPGNVVQKVHDCVLYALRRAAVVSQMGAITTLVDRVSRFVLDITVTQRKFQATGDKHWFNQLSPPEIPAFL
jgi:hypothetical protein